ncbi:LPXTG cell wall anchor domain-containing protein [Atopobium fossor]|uniref:LPXTG cell wall anchor domain-containing protein n=1 Tax=Atopobium fossor TaxID=39487 RepID=UPI000429CAA9|nr:LPXTG cell wall anchor domain-containing protein [Atopobium fossor]
MSKKMKKSTQAIAVATSAITVMSSMPVGAFAQQDSENPTPPVSMAVSTADSTSPKTHIDRTPANNLAAAQAVLDEAKQFSSEAQQGMQKAQQAYDEAAASEQTHKEKKIASDTAVVEADHAGAQAVQDIKTNADKKFLEASQLVDQQKQEVDKARQELEQAHAQEKQAQQAKKKAEEELAAAQKANPEASKQIEEKNTQIATLEQELARKTKDHSTAAEAKKQAEQLVKQAEDAYSQKNAEHAAATQKVEEATAARNQAQARVTDLQARYEAAKKAAENGSQQGDEAALQQVKEAQELVTARQAQLNQANQALSAAASTLKDAEAQLNTHKHALDEATAALQTQEQEVQKATDALKTAQANRQQAGSTVLGLQDRLKDAEDRLKDARQRVTQAESKIAQAEQSLDTLTKQLEEARKERDAIQARLKNTSDSSAGNTEAAKKARSSRGFFEHNGSTIAAQTFDQTTPYSVDAWKSDWSGKERMQGARAEDFTHVGEKGDATTLDNMRDALMLLKNAAYVHDKMPLDDDIQEGTQNKWYVSDAMMARAQVNANFSRNVMYHLGSASTKSGAHSTDTEPIQAHETGEILAWDRYNVNGTGMTEDTWKLNNTGDKLKANTKTDTYYKDSPVFAWYQFEANTYYETQRNKDQDGDNVIGQTSYTPKNGSATDRQTGHYTFFRDNPQYKGKMAMGAAVTTYNKDRSAGRLVHDAEIIDSYYAEQYRAKPQSDPSFKLYTIDDYIARLDSYINSLKTGNNQQDKDALIEVNNRIADLEKQIKEKESDRNLAQSQSTEAASAVQSGEKEVDNLIQQLQAATNRRDNAQRTVNQRENQLKAAQEKQQQLVEQKEQAQQKVQEAQQTVDSQKSFVEQLQSKATEAQKNLQEAQAKLAQAQQQAHDAAGLVETLKKQLDEAKDELSQKEQELVKLTQQQNQAQKQREDAQQQLNAQKQKLNDATADEQLKANELAQAQAEITTLTKQRDDLIAANDRITQAQAGVKQASKQLQDATAQVATLQLAVDAQDKKLTEARAQLLAAQTAVDEAKTLDWDVDKNKQDDNPTAFANINTLIKDLHARHQEASAASLAYTQSVNQLQDAMAVLGTARQYLAEALADQAWAQDQVNRLTAKPAVQPDDSANQSTQVVDKTPQHMADSHMQAKQGSLPKTGDTSADLAFGMSAAGAVTIAGLALKFRKKYEE